MRNDEHATKNYIDSSFLNKNVLTNGFTMGGSIIINGNKVTHLPTPTQDTDAATKKWSEDEFARKATLVNGFLPLSGGTLTSPVNFGNKELFGVKEPTTDTSTVSKR